MLIAIVHVIEDVDGTYRVVQQVVDVLPPGGKPAPSTATDEFDPFRWPTRIGSTTSTARW